VLLFAIPVLGAWLSHDTQQLFTISVPSM